MFECPIRLRGCVHEAREQTPKGSERKANDRTRTDDLISVQVSPQLLIPVLPKKLLPPITNKFGAPRAQDTIVNEEKRRDQRDLRSTHIETLADIQPQPTPPHKGKTTILMPAIQHANHLTQRAHSTWILRLECNESALNRTHGHA